MKHLLITSMIALGVGCGAAMAQTESVQPSSDCAAGAANCQKGGKAGEQAQGKMKSQTEQNAQGQAGAKTNEQAQGKMKPQTEQNAQGQTETGTGQNAQDNTKLKKSQQAQDKTKVQTDQQAQGKASAQDKTSTASINNVTVEQKTQITQVFRETKVEPVASVNFDVSVGIEVPRHKIRLHRLPARIVKIVPAYEAYEYFVLADGRIVIVDPDTYKIVLILT